MNAATATVNAPRPGYLELKANVHRKLLNRLNLEALASADRSRAEGEIRTLLFELIADEGTPLSMTEREAFLADIIDEVFGLGPLEPLLRDVGISDILVNTYKNVYVERQGKLERLPTTFQDDKHLMRVIDRIVSGVGRRVDDSAPMVDARGAPRAGAWAKALRWSPRPWRTDRGSTGSPRRSRSTGRCSRSAVSPPSG